MRSFSEMWYDPVARKKILLFGGGGLLFLIVLIIIIAVATSGSPPENFLGRYVLDEVPLIDGRNDLANNIYLREENLLEHFSFDSNLTTNDKWNTKIGGVSSHTDLEKLTLGKVRGQFWVARADCNSSNKDAVQLTLDQIDVIKRLIDKYEILRLVTTSEEIMEAFWNGKIASLIGVGGGHSIDSRMSVLRLYYEMGVRYMTLTDDCNTPWADYYSTSAENSVGHDGLTDFGKDVILEMNRLGMIVDISKASVETMKQVITTSRTPVIFSHSASKQKFDSPQNVDDEVLGQLAQREGIIMLNFGSALLSSADASIDTVIEQLDYFKSKNWIDNIGIGANYDGSDSVPSGLENVSKYPDLFDRLAEANETRVAWTREDLKKLASDNFMRVMRAVESFRDNKESPIPIKEAAIPVSDLKEDEMGCRSNYVKPTTVEPTTVEPTTVEPTTVEPTTVQSTTVEPTTVEPTTVEPTTVEPTTVEPTTVEPTTVEPTTVEPTTVEPTTIEPTTVEPTTVEPTTVEPTTNLASHRGINEKDSNIRPIAIGNTIRRFQANAGASRAPTNAVSCRSVQKFPIICGSVILQNHGYRLEILTLSPKEAASKVIYADQQCFVFGIYEMTISLLSEFNVWFIDDGTLGGNTDIVMTDLKTVTEKSATLGLKLNFSKCEIMRFTSQLTFDPKLEFPMLNYLLRNTPCWCNGRILLEYDSILKSQ